MYSFKSFKYIRMEGMEKASRLNELTFSLKKGDFVNFENLITDCSLGNCFEDIIKLNLDLSLSTGDFFLYNRLITDYSNKELISIKESIIDCSKIQTLFAGSNLYKSLRIVYSIQGKNDIDKTIDSLIKSLNLMNCLFIDFKKISDLQLQICELALAIASKRELIILDFLNINSLQENDIVMITEILSNIKKICFDKIVIVKLNKEILNTDYINKNITIDNTDTIANITVSEDIDFKEKDYDYMPVKKYQKSFLDLLKLSFKKVKVKYTSNVLKVIISILIVHFLIYNVFVFRVFKNEENTYAYSLLYIEKEDGSLFTDDDILLINNMNNVEYSYYFNHIIDGEYSYDEDDSFTVNNNILFLDYGSFNLSYDVLPLNLIDESNIFTGELPTKSNEVVVSSSFAYNLGETFPLSNVSYSSSMDNVFDSDVELTVVGITKGITGQYVYVTDELLMNSSYYQSLNSEKNKIQIITKESNIDNVYSVFDNDERYIAYNRNYAFDSVPNSYLNLFRVNYSLNLIILGICSIFSILLFFLNTYNRNCVSSNKIRKKYELYTKNGLSIKAYSFVIFLRTFTYLILGTLVYLLISIFWLKVVGPIPRIAHFKIYDFSILFVLLIVISAFLILLQKVLLKLDYHQNKKV